MVDIVALASELTTDPLTRGYAGMTDAQAAADLNTVNRDAQAAFSAVLDYMITTRAHTNQGQDTTANNTTPTTILGRLVHVAEQNILEAALPIDVFGAGDTPSDKRVTNLRELHAAKAFLEMLRSGQLSSGLFTASKQGSILSDLVNCGVMNTADRTAIIALSQNQQSRAQELEIGVVKAAHVAEARA